MDLSEQRLLPTPADQDMDAPAPTLVYSPHPLLPGADRRVEYALFLPRETVAEYLARVGIVLRGPAVLRLNGRLLPRGLWARTRPKPGMMLTIRAGVAGGGGGGGKDPLRTVLSIALIVAAGPAGSALASAAGFTAGAGYTAGQIAFAGAAFGAAVSIGGSLLINSLLPPPRPNLAEAQQRGMDSSPTYAIAGGANRARPYEPLPLLLGQHRFFPDLGAKEYTEFEGDQQFLYECYNFGFGDLLLTDLRIGNTPLASYADVQTEIAGADGKLKLFPGIVDTVEGGALEPDTPVQRTSSTAATALAVEITGALYQATPGGVGPLSVALLIQYRLAGGSTWLPFARGETTQYYSHYWSAGHAQSYVDPDGVVITGEWLQVDFGSTVAGDHVEGAAYGGGSTWHWRPYSEINGGVAGGALTQPAPAQGYQVQVDTITITNASTKPVRLTYKIEVPAGQYELRVERTTDAYTAATDTAQLVWSQLRSYRPDTADYTGQTRVALKIRATGQLNGRVDRFSALGSMRCPAWDGVSTWAQIETANPAWLILYLARGGFINGRKVFGAGLADARIDIDGLKAFGAWCKAKSLSFNGIVDRAGMSTQALIEAIALCGRGSISWASGKLGVVWDAPDQAVSAVYGMGNIVGSTMRMQYITENVTQEIVLYFVNPDLDWQQDFVRAVVPGTVGTPTRTVRVDLWGCTDRDMAGRQANLMAADQYYHNARLYFETDIEGFVNTRGDTIVLAHDLMRSAWGYSGRLIDGSTASTLKLGRTVPFTAGQNHYVLVKKPDGTFGIHGVTYQAGESDTLTLPTPLGFDPSADADGHPVYDYVWMFDLRATPGRRVKIVDIPKVTPTRVQIVAVDDSSAYYAAEGGEYVYIPPAPAGDNAPVLANLAVSEQLVLVGSVWLTRVTLTWDVTSGRYDHAIVRIGIDGGPLEERGTPHSRRFELDVPVGSALAIEVTGVHPLGYTVAGSKLTNTHTVLGQVTAPAAPTALLATAGLFAVHLSWTMDMVSRRDIRHTEIWAANTNDRAAAARLTCAPFPESDYTHIGLAPAQQWYYWVRIEDTSHNFSAWYPAGATAGVPGTPSADPSDLLAQLQDAVGMAQLAQELAAPIEQVQPIAEAALRLLLKIDEAKLQAITEKWVTDATVEIDRVAGTVTLLATAEISTDIEARIHSVEIGLGAQDGTIIAHTASLSNHSGRITVAESDIALLEGSVSLKASTSYVDSTIAGALGALDPAAQEVFTNANAIGLLHSLLDTDAGRVLAQSSVARLASAERTLDTHADAISAEATERLIVAAKVDVNLAAIVSEASARATADAAEASARITLAATVAANSAAISSEQTARANGDSANASDITTLEARLDTGDFAAVKVESSANANAIGDVEAKWGVQVQTMADGTRAMAGITLLAGTDGESVFAVLADKLLVYKPDGSGTPKQIVTLGTVNGVTALGLLGDLIVDGTIVTRTIAADNVTQPVSASSAGITNLTTPGTLYTVQSVTITTSGAPVLIIGASSLNIDTGFFAYQSLYRDSTQIHQVGMGGNSSVSVGVTNMIVDTPAAGTYTYTLRAQRSGGTNDTCKDRTLLALEIKR